MKVDVYNRSQVEGLEPTPNTVVISISNPSLKIQDMAGASAGTPADLKDGWEAVLRVEFHDVVKVPHDMPDIVAFSQEHVDAIHAFVETYLDKDFVIHCDAGVSRSVAIGLYLQDVYDAELHTHAIDTTRAANSRVHRGLIRTHWAKRLES